MKARWDRLVVTEAITTATDRLYDELDRAYSDASRSYHTWQHIEECLEHLDFCRSATGGRQTGMIPESGKLRDVELAIWYHDVVCVPGAADNEVRSAGVAGNAAAALGAGDRAALIGRLIRATEHIRTGSAHHPPDGVHVTDESGLTDLIRDIDIAILGSSSERFDEYEQQIRREYSQVDHGTFVRGRTNMIRQFLARPWIFRTRPFSDRFEQRARENLRRSLGRMMNQSADQ